MKKPPPFLAFFCGLVLLPSLFWVAEQVEANSEIERLQDQISERSDRLSEIEAEITRFELALLEVGAERETLQKAINQLELERKKVVADIAFTENKISSTDLELNKLILEISRTEADIEQNQTAIAEIIRQIDVVDDDTLVEVLLQHERLSDFWSTVERYQTVRNEIVIKVEELESLQELLVNKRDETTEQRDQLVALKEQYDDQSQVLLNNRAEQADLLQATRNEESEYQRLLDEKQSAREQILAELRSFEAELQFILDPTTIPTPGTQVFQWPLKNIIITQYFGGTEFARRNPGIYGGRAYHPGVDFGAPRGTQLFAPLSGVVRATGNTDAVPGCYSWGKWTLIDHANGLSTLYAHQDLISVTPGQTVSTGEIIGYIGNTGFSTGPHLHFSVYATDGVSVRQFNEIKTVTSCGPASTPVAATEAYLDPMDYLPPA
ncbi:MAG: peptidoglycan DD-metalloendopeptidase family protein [Patescibacteria group bacterium]